MGANDRKPNATPFADTSDKKGVGVRWKTPETTAKTKKKEGGWGEEKKRMLNSK